MGGIIVNNPFLQEGFLTPNASINKVIIEKMPTDKVKQDLQGKPALHIFSTELFIEEIKKNSQALKIELGNIEEKLLPHYFNECLEDDDFLVKSKAEELHEYLTDLIINTIKSVSDQPLIIGNHIAISVANYVKKGLFADRGGYGKLRLISNNYEEYLSDAIYEKLGVRFKISLIHDGTAMAAAFSKYEKAVCISLGTSFGVGFPIDIN